MKTRSKILLVVFGLLIVGILVPDRRVIPVAGATKADWNDNTFWYEPWGSSGVQGIDIFSGSLAQWEILVMLKVSPLIYIFLLLVLFLFLG